MLREGEVLEEQKETLPSLMAHDSLALTTLSKAFEQAGDYVLRFVVNPSRKHEANFSNNSAQILVKVKQDNIAPTMLVQVNGRIPQNYEHFPP